MHERLESVPRLARLVDPDLTRREYCEVLERMLGFQERAEAEVEAYEDELPLNFAARRKSQAIKRDLEHLGYSRSMIDAVPRCSHVAEVTGVDPALGVLYVLEGSTLGARIIRRHLERSIQITADRGGRYYAGYGENTGPMWKALGEAINDRAAGSGSVDSMVASARTTFTALHTWMTR